MDREVFNNLQSGDRVIIFIHDDAPFSFDMFNYNHRIVTIDRVALFQCSLNTGQTTPYAFKIREDGGRFDWNRRCFERLANERDSNRVYTECNLEEVLTFN